MSDDPEKFQIDWLRAIAGAVAAVASAVLLSTLGAAGTIIGAAIGSLVVTITSALITQGLSTSRRTLAMRQEGAAEKVGVAQAEVLRAERADDTAAQESHLEHAEERLAEAREDLDEAVLATSPVSWRERLHRLPWMRISITTLALFLAALVVITAFELVVGRSVSSITGGSEDTGNTTIGQVGGQDSSKPDHQEPVDQPTEPTTPSDAADPSEIPTGTPAESPTGSPSPSASQEPSPAESTAATASPSPSGTSTP